jgi:hypothetical protein
MSYFEQLAKKYKAVLYFSLAFAAISFYLIYGNWVKPLIVEKDEKLLQLIVVVVAGITVIVGFQQFNKNVLALRTALIKAPEKLKEYRKHLLKWWSALAFGVVLSLTGFLLATTYSFFILACFIIGILGMFMPRKATIALLLKLSEQELLLLDKEL